MNSDSQVSVNRRCVYKYNPKSKHSEILQNCSKIPDILLTDVIGEGGYGIVYLGTTKDSKQVAIKFIKKELENEDYEIIDKEIAFSYYMGTTNLAPKLYDAFYVINKKTGEFKQCLIMEYFKYNGIDALKRASDSQKRHIINEMIRIIKEMIITYKMYCIDIKPANFVISENLETVKIIDFGADWCRPGDNRYDDKKLFQLMVFQLFILVIEDMVTDVFKNTKSTKLKKKLNILELFDSNAIKYSGIFEKYFDNRLIKWIKEILKDFENYDENNEMDSMYLLGGHIYYSGISSDKRSIYDSIYKYFPKLK